MLEYNKLAVQGISKLNSPLVKLGFPLDCHNNSYSGTTVHLLLPEPTPVRSCKVEQEVILLHLGHIQKYKETDKERPILI